ncbi:HhH-GPD-type base excision DNA repair protein [Brevibacterium yomogidense]|uniref:HhH-GPD-type base excision DNA repair protein n=1 Tax=Brevibacterium yomogidense TaxID=946573 RepID=UPI0015C643E7|nr:HhH-GPD-type base excision DNA repair protein [Brevibacterium yomogidense]
MTSVYLSTDPQADELLTHDRFALMVGMLLDQQVTMESAFAGPQKLSERLDEFTPEAVAALDPDALLEAFKEKPAVHRYPGSMATRVQALAQTLVDDYDGVAENLWTAPTKDGSAPTGKDILRRLKALPGFGDQKSKIFVALLGKQFGLTADGWREAAGDYGPDDAFRSIADVRDEDSLFRVRENKKAMKAAAKAAKDAKKS